MTSRPTSPECAYGAAALASPKAFEEVEASLDKLPSGTHVAPALLQRLTSGRVNYEEILLVMRNLASLGAVESLEGASWILEGQGLAQTADFRRGVKAAVNSLKSPPVSVRMVASLPESIDDRARNEIRQHATDLTAAVIDLIVAAKRSLILASPFWDDESLQKLEPILRRRLDEGVDVLLLVRSTKASEEAGKAIASFMHRVHDLKRLRVLTWFEEEPADRWGSRTFHFKAAVADEGDRGYLGSANFTTGGLQSRLELGVVLSGAPALALYHLLSAVIRIAR